MNESINLIIAANFGLIVVVYGIYLMIKHLRKGQIRWFSIWAKEPLSFKKNPVLASMLLIAELVLVIGFLILYFAMMFHFD